MERLRLGFIGKDWQRKGLLYLLKIAENLELRSVPVEIIAVGPRRDESPSHPLLKTIGFIDKDNKTKEFIDIVKKFHFGCLFSKAETFGISNLECLRLGVPVLTNSIGGIKEGVPQGLGYVFNPDAPIKEIGDLLEYYFKNPIEYAALRKRVLENTGVFSWNNAVNKFIELWQKNK